MCLLCIVIDNEKGISNLTGLQKLLVKYIKY